jgi:hypothetical protein
VIVIYTGRMGSGKTMLAVDHARGLAKRRGAALASNIAVVPPSGVVFEQLETGTDGFDVAQLEVIIEEGAALTPRRGLVLLLDEIGLLMPARQWAKFPVDLIMTMTQSRKMRIDIIATAQFESMVDVIVRDNAQVTYFCRSVPPASLEGYERGRRPLAFRVTKWEPGHVNMKGRKLGSRGLFGWLPYRRSMERWYDTDEIVRPPARLAVDGSDREYRRQLRRDERAARLVLGSIAAAPSSP